MMTGVLRDAQYLAPEFLALSKDLCAQPGCRNNWTPGAQRMIEKKKKKNAADGHFISSM